MNEDVQVRLDPLGMVCALACVAIVAYTFGKISQASAERRKRELEDLREHVWRMQNPKPDIMSEPMAHAVEVPELAKPKGKKK